MSASSGFRRWTVAAWISPQQQVGGDHPLPHPADAGFLRHLVAAFQEPPRPERHELALSPELYGLAEGLFNRCSLCWEEYGWGRRTLSPAGTGGGLEGETDEQQAEDTHAQASVQHQRSSYRTSHPSATRWGCIC